MVRWILILSVLALCSCREHKRPDVSEDAGGLAVEVVAIPDWYQMDLRALAERSGIQFDGLIRCVVTSGLDSGRTEWISFYDDSGQLDYVLLFRWMSSNAGLDGDRSLTVFRERIRAGKLQRVQLTSGEALAELGILEKYLMGFLGEETYQKYSSGDHVEEVAANIDSVDSHAPDANDPDPFASLVDVISPDQKNPDRMNQLIAKEVVDLIRCGRVDVEEGRYLFGEL